MKISPQDSGREPLDQTPRQESQRMDVPEPRRTKEHLIYWSEFHSGETGRLPQLDNADDEPDA